MQRILLKQPCWKSSHLLEWIIWNFWGIPSEDIATQKAGIIKPHTTVVSAWQEPEAAKVITKVCEEQGCVLKTVNPSQITAVTYNIQKQQFSYKDWKQITIPLAGSYQILNAALALEAVEALKNLGFSLTDAQVYEGFAKTVWKGRFTLLATDPAVILDGAHNPSAAKELQRSLNLYFKGKKLYYIFGVFKDKDYGSYPSYSTFG